MSTERRRRQGVILLAVPTAYRSWSYWCNACGAGNVGYQVGEIRNEADQLTPKQQLKMLCEVFSRATMEVSIGLHFDNLATDTDLLVLEHIAQMFGTDVRNEVVKEVYARGPVREKCIELTLLTPSAPP